jgi:Protein of unknown function (DUF1580)
MGDECRYVSFAKVARRLDVHPYSVFRWHKVGRGPDHVRLKAWKIGGRWKTTWKAVRHFLAELNAEPVPLQTTGERKRQQEADTAAAKKWVKPWKRL